MKIHLDHLSPHGIVRALSHVRAGYSLCRKYNVKLRSFIPESVNSMTPAWNFHLTIEGFGLAKPRTIIDIGANISQMTKLLLLSCEANTKVISFEPNPGLQPIGEHFTCALSDEDGATDFVISQNDPLWGRIQDKSGRPDSGDPRFQVCTARFHSLVQNKQLAWEMLLHPVLVKIDAEGSEFKALKGFGDLLQDIEYLLVEVENREDRGQNYTMMELCNYLSKYGFNSSKVLYALFDGPLSPAYMDTMFWKNTGSNKAPELIH